MADKIEFKCPHTTKTFKNRVERIAERSRKLEVPENAVWQPVQDVRMGKYGIPELYDVEGIYYTLVECPICGATKRVQTDKKVM